MLDRCASQGLSKEEALPPMDRVDLAQDDQRWLAVATRDAAADGHFVFAVRTTGIYCRPSCPARTAKRENVTFYASPAEARRHGFRACRRCKPDAQETESIAAATVAAAARLIDEAIAAEGPAPSLKTLAGRAGYSPFHFHRLFRQHLGVTPRGYAAAVRAARLRDEMEAAASVTQAIHGAGYSSSSRFYETASARLGMKPAAHLRGGEGERIVHAFAQTSLGLLLVAATGRGVCAIQFGESRDDLAAELRARFPRAVITPADVGFDAMLARVVALVEDPRHAAGIPLDIRGTAFQERVWQALQAIPPGRTASYAEIASAIGQPGAARGVAGACAANPVAVAVPCHRVVRADGALSGYRWGTARKASSLEREGAKGRR